MERGGGVAQTAVAHDGLLLEIEFEEVVYANAVCVPRPKREVFCAAEVSYSFLDGDLHWVVQRFAKDALPPCGHFRFGDGLRFALARTCAWSERQVLLVIPVCVCLEHTTRAREAAHGLLITFVIVFSLCFVGLC